jgi:hypothetical protein
MDLNMLARIEALVAEKDYVNATIEAMKAANERRRRNGEADAYGEQSFADCANQLNDVATGLRTLAGVS